MTGTLFGTSSCYVVETNIFLLEDCYSIKSIDNLFLFELIEEWDGVENYAKLLEFYINGICKFKAFCDWVGKLIS